MMDDIMGNPESVSPSRGRAICQLERESNFHE